MHLLQPLAHLLEALPESLFQRVLKLFVHGLAHLFQALAVVLTNLLQLLFNRFAHVLDRLQRSLSLVVELLE